MSAKTTFGRRLTAAMLDLASRRGSRVTDREVGEAVGLTGESVGVYRRDGIESHAVETVARLAAYLGVCAAWLAFGTGPMRGEGCGEVRSDATSGRRAPVTLAGPAARSRRKQG